MKKLNTLFFAMAITMALSSCTAIAGIFKAGFAVGIIVVVVIILLLVWVFSFFRGRD